MGDNLFIVNFTLSWTRVIKFLEGSPWYIGHKIAGLTLGNYSDEEGIWDNILNLFHLSLGMKWGFELAGKIRKMW